MYSHDFKMFALEKLREGRGIRATARWLGIGSSTLERWGKDSGTIPRRSIKPRVYLPYEEKRSLVARLQSGERAADLARESGVTPGALFNWRRRLLEEGEVALMRDDDIRRIAGVPGGAGGDRGDGTGGEVEALRRRVYELELENAVLAGTIDIIKKDPGADASSLTNREKATLAGALRDKFRLNDLLGFLGLARSTYYGQLRAMGRPDKYADLRVRIGEIFEAKRRAWGSERIWAELRRPHDGGEPVVVSEKVVRRIMREGGMAVVYSGKRRRYSSYRGEIGAHPGNKVNRDFHAGAPNMLWLTDVTQFALPGFKCYLSPVVDCFDGKVVAHRISRSPDAELANSMLEDACALLGEGERPTVHSDCGCHYRWPGWLGICERFGLVRSMSRKGCSPDNSACEGFFGRLKNEMFYGRDWSGVTFEEFAEEVDGYIEEYNETRIKKSLGWMSPNEYRRSKGYAA